MPSIADDTQLVFGEVRFSTSRPHSFGLVIDGPDSNSSANFPEDFPEDYLHDVLLAPSNRDAFMELIDRERLVICKKVRTNAPSYRKVRGKSSVVKLSQAEYYHHDGCSSPTKPRVVEIRFPHQDIARNIATAIAPFPAVIRSMLMALPATALGDNELASYRDSFSGLPAEFPPPATWDHIQGKITRMVRREMDAEACRAFFRTVDEHSDAYVLPWEMGESRLMLNSHDDLTQTMQHRRSYQKARETSEQNGSLVKRWTAEEA